MPFAPAIEMELVTPAPKARSALVATITQAEGESAVASTSLRFPPQFTFNERFRPPRCQPEQEAAEACPPESRVGTVEAISDIAPASGEVFITDDFRLVVFAQALGGLISIKANGTIEAFEDNSFGITFSGLPDLPLRSVQFALEGGDLALIKNPARCGEYTLPATFQAHGSETARDTAQVAVTGCPPPLRVRRPRYIASRDRLSWRVSDATTATQVVVKRKGEVVARRRAKRPRVRLALEPGRYQARLTPLAGKRRGRTTMLRFTV